MADAVRVALFLAEKVLMFLPNELDRPRILRDHVNIITAHLQTMKAVIQYSEGCERNEMMVGMVDQIRKAAHETEDVLDDYTIHAFCTGSTSHITQNIYEFFHNVTHRSTVDDILRRIATIVQCMSDINKSHYFMNVVKDLQRTQPLKAHMPYMEAEEDEIIGFDTAHEDITCLLLSEGRRECDTIFVVGPNGAGKTTLVKRVYKSNRVIDQFDCYAWLSSTGSIDRESFLQRLLSQFCKGIYDTHGGDAATKLANYLEKKRFLVVLDGVLRHEEWMFIKRASTASASGSWIIVTTHFAEIVAKCIPFNPHVVTMDGLDWMQSWKLFCRKAYENRGGKCPPELRDLSELIVKRCENLPYPISMAGSLLSTRPLEQREWKRVHENLAMELQSSCINPMFLRSYSYLPARQQSCLLYFSIFPEDFSIKRERLIRLWMSEGFVDENEARKTLNELISMNLVHLTSRDFRGRVKSCRVLNLMRGFVCQKSVENKFAQVITQASSSHHQMQEANLERRLSIQCTDSLSQRIGGLKMESVRSIFMFRLDSGTDHFQIIQRALGMMKRLRVLDLEGAPLFRFPECLVSDVRLLRYLSLKNTRISVIPANIKNLRYLEFLDLKQTQVSRLPKEICLLENLRDLLVYRCTNDSFERLQGAEIDGDMTVFPVLIRKLSLIKAKQSSEFFNTLFKLTNLKKLGLVNLRKEYGRSLCYCINNMPHLFTLDLTSSHRNENLNLESPYFNPERLEHLYLKGRLTQPKWFSSLTSLFRLILRGSRLNSSIPFKHLQTLPNLMELEMSDAFTGNDLIIDTGAFPKLRTLRIENFDSLRLIVIEEKNKTLPFLQKLTLVRCMLLHELPRGIEGLKCLEELTLYDMPRELINRLHKSSSEPNEVRHKPIINSYVSGRGTWHPQLQNLSLHENNR